MLMTRTIAGPKRIEPKPGIRQTIITTVIFGLTLAALVAAVFFLALAAPFLGAPVDFAVPTAFFAFGVGAARVLA